MTPTPTQVAYLGLSGQVLFAFVLLVATVFFLVTASRRVQLLLIGAGERENRFDHPFRRLWHVVEFGLLQRKMWRDPYAGLYHMLIFSGFVVLLVRTASLILEGLFPGAALPFLPGGLWEGYLLAKDIVLVTTFAGVLLALGRRHLFRKERLDPSFDADLILLLIALLMVTDVTAGAARDAMSPASASAWEPLTLFLSRNLPGFSFSSLQTLYFSSWWLHLLSILFFLNYLPFAKHFHVLTALPNLFFAKLDPPGKMATIDIEKAAEAGVFGVGKVEDFTWKQKLDIYTCTECGRCREICPTHLTGKPLTPKGFTVDLRHALFTDAPALLDAATGFGGGRHAADLEKRKPLIGGWVLEDTIWACTTCRYCEHACPVGITYVDKITDLRRHLVLERSEFPREAQTAFNGMERQGNPWNLAAADRSAWTKELAFPVPTMAEAGAADVEVLFWVGCAGSYEDRGRKVSRALATLLHEAGVKFAILGSEETCTGDAARRLGNEYLFQLQAQALTETLNGHAVKKILVQCPHCLNTLANELPQFGGRYEVVHHAQLIARLGGRQLRVALLRGLRRRLR
ncbi:MAG: (Fe-S)-binding protein [Acidithiobacillales bacterium]